MCEASFLTIGRIVQAPRAYQTYQPWLVLPVSRIFAGSPFDLHAGVSLAAVRGALRKVSLSRLSHPEQAQPVRHYVREHRGALILLNTKTLVNFSEVGYRIRGNREVQSNRRRVGWEYDHTCIDNTSSHSFTDIFPDQKATTASTFHASSVAYYNIIWVPSPAL